MCLLQRISALPSHAGSTRNPTEVRDVTRVGSTNLGLTSTEWCPPNPCNGVPVVWGGPHNCGILAFFPPCTAAGAGAPRGLTCEVYGLTNPVWTDVPGPCVSKISNVANISINFNIPVLVVPCIAAGAGAPGGTTKAAARTADAGGTASARPGAQERTSPAAPPPRQQPADPPARLQPSASTAATSQAAEWALGFRKIFPSYVAMAYISRLRKQGMQLPLLERLLEQQGCSTGVARTAGIQQACKYLPNPVKVSHVGGGGCRWACLRSNSHNGMPDALPAPRPRIEISVADQPVASFLASRECVDGAKHAVYAEWHVPTVPTGSAMHRFD